MPRCLRSPRCASTVTRADLRITVPVAALPFRVLASAHVMRTVLAKRAYQHTWVYLLYRRVCPAPFGCPAAYSHTAATTPLLYTFAPDNVRWLYWQLRQPSQATLLLHTGTPPPAGLRIHCQPCWRTWTIGPFLAVPGYSLVLPTFPFTLQFPVVDCGWTLVAVTLPLCQPCIAVTGYDVATAGSRLLLIRSHIPFVDFGCSTLVICLLRTTATLQLVVTVVVFVAAYDCSC